MMTMILRFSIIFSIAHSFVGPSCPSFVARRYLRLSPREEPFEFSDFGDFVAGEPSSSSPVSSQLQDRFQQVQHLEREKSEVISKNWNEGNWKVRGFSLDRFDPQADLILREGGDPHSAPIHVSKLFCSSEEPVVAVGRTDGSVVLVELGTEHWTKFDAWLSVRETSNNTLKVESQLVRSEESKSEAGPTSVPHQVIQQFVAHQGNEITALFMAENQNDETVIVTGDSSGQMSVWQLPDDAAENVVPLRNLEAHQDRIVALKMIQVENEDKDGSALLLFSASRDGSMALWDLWTGDMVFRCKCYQEDSEHGKPISILSADVLNNDIIVLGLENGFVETHVAREMIAAAAVGDACPLPNGKFLAHENGVTALRCSQGHDDGDLIIATGGADGVVKQWQLLPHTLSKRTTLQHWPRLSNQRLKGRAHLFQGHVEGPVSSLEHTSTHICSAGGDGTIRVWSAASGKELFRMDGFQDITSLCFEGEDNLITNGMRQFVCVHDFLVDIEEEIEDGYEFEW
jgi:WD40 repeat protein